MGRSISKKTYQTQEKLRRKGRLCAWHPSKPHRATLKVKQQITHGPGTGETVEMELCEKHAVRVNLGSLNSRTVATEPY